MIRLAPFALVFLSACTSTFPVTVDVRTDLIPGVEFTSVRTRAAEVPAITHDVDAMGSYAEGVRVAELVLPAESQELVVELLDAENQIVATRPIVADVTSSTAITVLITRDCRDVSCPLVDGPAAARACLGGGCVEATCTFETPATCTRAECASDGDCVEPSRPSCARPQCVTGACIYTPNNSLCGAEELCHPELGCRPAVNVNRCAAPDPDTVLQLSFDDETAADAVGRNPGTLVGMPAFVDGPLGCGRALSIPVAEDAHVEVDDSMDWHLDEGSIELWFRHEAGFAESGGLLSRDQRQSGNGHITIALSQEDDVVVRIQNAGGDESFACAGPLEPGVWHHLGVNFGPPGLEVWVDGERSTQTDTVRLVDSEDTISVDCASTGTVALRPADVLPWVLGATGIRADDATDWADFFRGGAIDHLRISSVRREFSSP